MCHVSVYTIYVTPRFRFDDSPFPMASTSKRLGLSKISITIAPKHIKSYFTSFGKVSIFLEKNNMQQAKP